MARLPFLLASVLALPGDGSQRPPHVILISIDTLRQDALAAFAPGAGALPALDRLAAESVRFTNAFSSASWTLPAHASLFTGLYPDRHGATDRRATMSADAPTLAGLLGARGYETVALTGGGFMGPEFGLGRGFERHEDHAVRGWRAAEGAEGLEARLAAQLAARRGERPLFLLLHTYAVHNYFFARTPAAERTGRAGLKRVKAYAACVLGVDECAPEVWDDLRALYRAELELLDASLAALRSALEQAGLWQEAVVVLLSDHGEGFAPELGRTHHGGRLHADQLRIPLFVRVPGVAPRAEAAPVSLVDLMPTLLELAGASVPPGLDGRSLVANLRSGAVPEPRALLAMEHGFRWPSGARESTPEVLDEPRELAILDAAGCYLSSERGEEWYALDDLEQRTGQLAGPERAAAYRALLGGRSLERVTTAPVQADEALLRELEALGYGGERDE